MNNNDILRRIRYALNLSDRQMQKIFALVQEPITLEEVPAIMGFDGADGAVYCTDDRLAKFLRGLIIKKRGPPAPGTPPIEVEMPLTNNDILKMLRIALKLRDSDIQEILKQGGHPMSKGEISALFRKPDNRHYRACGTQALRKFLSGLTQRLRPSKPQARQSTDTP